MRRHLLLAMALLAAVATVGDAGGEAIRARVRVVKAVEPGELEVYVSVPPAAANRAFTVTATCRGDEVQSSYRQLEGERSEGPFAPVVWRQLAGCQYVVTTALLGAGGQPIARAHPAYARILCPQCDDQDEP